MLLLLTSFKQVHIRYVRRLLSFFQMFKAVFRFSNLMKTTAFTVPFHQGSFSCGITTNTTLLLLNIELHYLSQFSTKVEFHYDSKRKTLTNYTIKEIIIHQ